MSTAPGGSERGCERVNVTSVVMRFTNASPFQRKRESGGQSSIHPSDILLPTFHFASLWKLETDPTDLPLGLIT